MALTLATPWPELNLSNNGGDVINNQSERLLPTVGIRLEEKIQPTPLGAGLRESDILFQAKHRIKQELESQLFGSPLHRALMAANIGEEVVADFTRDFLALSIQYLVSDATPSISLPDVSILGKNYSFHWNTSPREPDTIDFCLLAYHQTQSGLRKPKGNVSLDVTPQFSRARLFVPSAVKQFKAELGLKIIKEALETGYADLRLKLLTVADSFGRNLAPRLYDRVRQSSGDPDGDKHLIFAALPHGPGNGKQIIYLADTQKIEQLINQITPHAQGMAQAKGLGPSPFKLVSEMIQNRMTYELIHARHAVEKRTTQFDLFQSLYRAGSSAFTEAEIGWFRSNRIAILPFMNKPGGCLMAVCGMDHQERVAHQIEKIAADLENIFTTNSADAVYQLELLNKEHATEGDRITSDSRANSVIQSGGLKQSNEVETEIDVAKAAQLLEYAVKLVRREVPAARHGAADLANAISINVLNGTNARSVVTAVEEALGHEKLVSEKRTGRHVFRKQASDLWQLAFDGIDLGPFPNLKGMDYIAYLLSHPGESQRIMAKALYARFESPLAGNSSSEFDDASNEQLAQAGISLIDRQNSGGQKLDDRAIQSLKAKCKEIEATIQAQRANGETEAVIELTEELTRISTYLNSQIHWHGAQKGRSKEFQNPSHSDYTAVAGAIDRALKQFANPMTRQFRLHLNCFISRRNGFAYLPDPPITWET